MSSDTPIITPRMDFATLEDTQSFKSCRKDNNTLEFIEEDEVDNMSVTSLDSDGESEMVVNAKDNVKSSKLIQKPPGEPGRPGSGGWRLDAASLGWTKEMFDTLIDMVHTKTKKYLNPTLCYTKQSPESIEKVCRQMVKDMPKLAEYEKLWPARQQLKMHLKYTSEQARRVDYKDTAHKLERIIRNNKSSKRAMSVLSEATSSVNSRSSSRSA